MARASNTVFKSINNRVDSSMIDPDQMSVAKNIDIHDDESISLRDGRTLFAAETDPHSMWATADENTCYFVAGGVIKRLFPDGTTAAVKTLAADAPVAFCEVNNIVVYTDNVEIGFIQDGAAGTLRTSSRAHKIPVVAGRFLAFYNSRLFILNDDGLNYTDSYDIDQMDERNHLFPLLGRPTMLQAAGDCLWVGKGMKTIAITGKEPKDFEYESYDSEVVLGSGVTSDIPTPFGVKTAGEYVLFVSDAGICIGMGNGDIQVVTEDFLSVKPASNGAATLRLKDGMAHYVAVLTDTGAEVNKSRQEEIPVSTEIIGG
jgi:hypothetical protein